MARSKSANLIDGFSSVQAVRRAGRRTDVPSPAPAADPDAAAPASAASPYTPRIGHSVLPERHDITCYECGYGFRLQGQLHNTICPKCHAELEKSDVVVDRACSRPLRTIGTVLVKPEGEVGDVTITAGNVTVAGRAERATLNVSDTLELRQGAAVDLTRATARRLRIAEGASFVFDHDLVCGDLDVLGSLRAVVHASGLVSIGPHGRLRGALHTQRLEVMDGGGMHVDLTMGHGSESRERQDRPPQPSAATRRNPGTRRRA